MDASHEFLRNLALVFCVAGVTTVIFQRLRQPVIFGYLLAGFIIGPNTPIPLVADDAIVRTFAELGVIMLLFSLGLEFSLRKLIKVGPAAGAIAVGETSAMMWVGYLLGRALGWTTMESVYTGAIIAIASTTIILKAFSEQGLRERFTRLVFGVLIVEDLIAIFVVAILTAISSGETLTTGAVVETARALLLFLAGLIGIGLLIVPRLIRFIVSLDRPETTLVATIGLCFGCALLALTFGYSVALGAFIGGSLVAESGHGRRIEHLIRPVRDIFGAMFFVAVGMLIDPALIMEHLGAVIVLTVAVIVGKVTFVTLMSVLTGQDVRTSVRTGMSLAQIGEFSFIIAGLGLTLGATGQFLYPVAVAVSAITAFTTPWLITASNPVAAFVDRKLPRRLQMFVGLYGSWFERMQHNRPTPGAPRRRLKKPILLLLVDAALLLGLIITTVLELPRLTAFVSTNLNLDARVASWVVLSVAVFACAFLCVGIWRVNLRVSSELAWRAFPPTAKGVDYAAAPRRALLVTLRIVILVLIGLPLVALTQPFIPLFRGSVLLVILLGILAIAFWRSVSNLHGHARAGAEIILMALSKQMKDDVEEQDREPELERIRLSLPGLGEPVAIRIPADAPCILKTLAQLNLRGQTGATVLAISRNGEDVLLPNGHEALRGGDTLFVGGTQRAVASARALLLMDARV